jgi:hypothetical protein
MHNLPFDTVDLDADEVQTLEDTYKSLKEKFSTASPGTADVYLNKFELFNNNPEASVGGTLFINYPATNCYLNFVKSSFSYSYGGRGGNGGQSFVYDKYQVWAFVNLKRDCDRILIRKETFADRLLEIIHPIELKFKEDRIFSDNFYVVANDVEKATTLLTSDFRKIMTEMMYKDFVIEIINKTLVIRNNQPINPDQVIHLAEIACKIASIN